MITVNQESRQAKKMNTNSTFQDITNKQDTSPMKTTSKVSTSTMMSTSNIPKAASAAADAVTTTATMAAAAEENPTIVSSNSDGILKPDNNNNNKQNNIKKSNFNFKNNKKSNFNKNKNKNKNNKDKNKDNAVADKEREQDLEQQAKEDIDLMGIPSWIRELMHQQPTLNIMTIGSVSHGKSTLMWGLCDEKTGRHSKELKKNMTIKLGYTSCKIYKCINCRNVGKICYFSVKSSSKPNKVQCPRCKIKAPFVILVRHISFVDCPGHAEFMGTMISAACVADGAIMVIDASRQFPSLQTVQHTSAAHLLGVLTNSDENNNQNDDENESKTTESNIATLDLENEFYNGNINGNTDGNEGRVKVIVAQNKIDLIDKQKACKNVEEIRQFLYEYDERLSRDTPIIPISAQSRLNLDALCLTMVKRYPKFSPRLLIGDNNCGKSYIERPLAIDDSSNMISGISGIGNDSNHSETKPVTWTTNENPMMIKKSEKSLQINIIRSFDVNRPCVFKTIEDIDKMIHGGVLGGTIINGTIKVGSFVTIRPGIVKTRSSYKASTQDVSRMTVAQKIKHLLKPKYEYQTIEAKVIGLKCGEKSLKSVFPGANVGVMMNIDPCLAKSDERAGDVICNGNEKDIRELPIFNVFIMKCVLLKPFDNIGFNLLESIKVNIGSAKINGFIVKKKVAISNNNNNDNNGVMVVLERPICARITSQVTITRKMKGEWRLAAGGIIFRVRRCVPSKTE